jgi:hypothetical protein
VSVFWWVSGWGRSWASLLGADAVHLWAALLVDDAAMVLDADFCELAWTTYGEQGEA